MILPSLVSDQLYDYNQDMVPIHALVFHRTKPAIVLATENDRITIRTIDGEEKRIREKDLAIAHIGPVASFGPKPEDLPNHQVQEALELLMSEHPEGISLVSWGDFTELAWNSPQPSNIVLAWYSLKENPEVELFDGGIRIRSEEERNRIAEKALRKKLAIESRSRFLSALRLALKKKDPSPISNESEFIPFLEELARYARGKSTDCPLAREAGLKLTPEAVHEALLACGYWSIETNPWPERIGCILTPPEWDGMLQERKELGIERVDLRHLPSYAIDNAWSHDPDDAISLDGDTVWVHVADPASMIEPQSTLDREAMERGSTLYLPERIISMLPEALVQTLGLGLVSESPALSFGMTLDSEGRLIQTTLVPSVVKVTRLSYEEADSLLDQNPTLNRLAKIAALRSEYRRRQGAIDISFPEVSIRVNQGNPVFLTVPETISSRMVQEFMILAGEAAARWAYRAAIPFPYASQESPTSPESAGVGAGLSESLAENFRRKRSMRASVISPVCAAHSGLGLSFYSQVTSPLRRYQDLVAHYQIHAMLAAQKSNADADRLLISSESLEERMYRFSAGAGRNREAERNSRVHWTLVFLERHREWQGEGIILDCGSEYGQIFIPEFGYEFQSRIPRGLKPDAKILLKLRRVSIPELQASFDIIPR
ncbi:MAG: RNB domain-containing ribonuclease [Rectinema sp.]|nr:RNB domain-containing ribonuclease [Rectinema sp.]